ncbi:UBP-type zinc finger domain-containing protein (plasmid) [Streptomyces sp. BI20]|uniref:UBP-type zinc finger domain-containing protein n=1 Tax=Streptomyces sp. BI20 TaxID=3403460 RepID=UPI003C71D751
MAGERTGRGAGGAAREPVWRVAVDGGRPEGRGCAHLGGLPAGPAPGSVPRPARCPDCPPSARPPVRLWWCAECGHVGCCDSSPGRHAHAHHRATGHPVVLRAFPTGGVGWCWADEAFLTRGRAAD